MNTLVDSAAFYALADRRDERHEQSLRFYEQAIDAERLCTTDYVLVETWTLIAHRLGRPAAMRFWDGLSTGIVPMLGVGAEDLAHARGIAHDWADQGFSLVDCTSMAVMERLGIERVFTFDGGFDRFRYGEDRERFFARVPR